MARTLVLTVIGPDRPGLVEELARVIAAHGGSWDESRMARLAGHFAGVVQIHLPDEAVPGLVPGGVVHRASCHELCPPGCCADRAPPDPVRKQGP